MSDEFFEVLRARFDAHPNRHSGLRWDDVAARLSARPDALRAVEQMERTGGEPDVVGRDDETGEIHICDCSGESPPGRRSLCYDGAALEARKKHKPRGSAVEAAREMGADLLTEAEYRRLQEFGPFDTRTSSWLRTPADVRSLGGALFGDHRFGRVFVYHNGAESYYAARGFRCILRV